MKEIMLVLTINTHLTTACIQKWTHFSTDSWHWYNCNKWRQQHMHVPFSCNSTVVSLVLRPSPNFLPLAVCFSHEWCHGQKDGRKTLILLACERSHHGRVQLCRTMVVLLTKKAVQTYVCFFASTMDIGMAWQQQASATVCLLQAPGIGMAWQQWTSASTWCPPDWLVKSDQNRLRLLPFFNSE